MGCKATNKLKRVTDDDKIPHLLLAYICKYVCIPRYMLSLFSEQEVIQGLAKKGHILKEMKTLAVVQGIYCCRPHCPDPRICDFSDFRKGVILVDIKVI